MSALLLCRPKNGMSSRIKAKLEPAHPCAGSSKSILVLVSGLEEVVPFVARSADDLYAFMVSYGCLSPRDVTQRPPQFDPCDGCLAFMLEVSENIGMEFFDKGYLVIVPFYTAGDCNNNITNVSENGEIVMTMTSQEGPT